MSRKVAYIILMLLMPLLMSANSSTAPDLQDTLREVTVVNQRLAAIEESRSSSVNHIYMRQIEQEQRINYKDLSGMIPNLYVPDYGSRMTSTIYMRGLGARIDNPVLGMYIDGVGIANKNSYDFDLFDIRSIRVARGPQGTLFGRNTIGGIMTIQTISPLDWQGIRATAGYGNYNNGEGKVSVYKKIDRKAEWGIAGSAYYRHTDGYFTNQYDGKRVDPSDEAGVRLRVDGRNEKGYQNSTFLSYNFLQQGGFPYHKPGEGINHNDTCAYRRHNLIFGSSYTFPAGDFKLSGTTSYQFLNDDMRMDQDYMPLPYFTLEQAQQEHYVSQELTLRPKSAYKTKQSGLAWDWLTGMQLSYKHQSMLAPVHFMQTGIDSLILKNANKGIHTAFPEAEMVLQEDNFVIGSRFTTQALDVAAYHTSFLNIGNWQIEAGVRLDFEYQHFRYLSDGTVHYMVKNTPITDWREIESKVEGVVRLPYFEALPKIAATYISPKRSWRAYASIAEGYKAGGFNTQLFSDILQNRMMSDMMQDMGVSFADGGEYTVSEVITYKPERCLTFEAGISGNYKKDDLRLEGAATAYELEVFNQQLTTYPKRGTGRLMTNAGHSRSAGAEVTGSIDWKGLSFSAAYGYTYAYFVNYDNGRQDYSGNRVPYMPENTVSGSLQYRFEFDHKVFRALTLNVNTNAYGRIFWDEENEYVQPMYALLNANIILQMKYVSLELWGKNLTQTKYDVFRFVSMGNTFLQSGRPLTFGGKIKVEI